MGAGQGAIGMLNAAQGFQRGGVLGTAQGLTGMGSAYNSLYGNQNGSMIPGVGMASNALGIINGLKAGGVMGYGSAAINAGGLANQFGAGIPGLGPASAVLSTYNAIKNWQGGKPGADALQGAEAGAAWGSLFGPIGTGVGAVIGGAVGALSGIAGNQGDAEAAMSVGMDHALGKLPSGQATQAAAMMSPSSATTYLQSAMSAENNSPGHSTGLEMAFGRNNVAGFTGQMDSMLTGAMKSGHITQGMSPQQVYTDVVMPWLKGKNANPGNTTGGGSYTDHSGNNMTPGMTGAIEALIGGWMANPAGSQLTSMTAPTAGGHGYGRVERGAQR